MQFGRDVKRGGGALWADPATVELLPLAALRRETAAAGLAAHRAAKAERPSKLLTYVGLAVEIARRTGEAESLASAASAAERARRLAVTPAMAAEARLAQAATAMLGGALFADAVAVDSAESWIATPEVAATPALAPQAMALRARIEAGRALGGADLDQAVEAAGVFDAAVARLDARVRDEGKGKVEAAILRCDRAEFLIGFGMRLKSRSLLVQAEADLRQLRAGLDPDRLPLTWARVESLRGSAQAALGDLGGEPRVIAEAVRTLASAVERADAAYSPLERARISHTLGLALQSLAEASEDEALFDHAVAAFDQALAGLTARGLPLRAMLIHDRAACVARRAERAGDLAALAAAEATFKAELAARGAAADPVAWAVAQLGLARVYEARAMLQGDSGPPEGSAVALTEAIDVFNEEGLKSLADLADDALTRLREGYGERP